MELAVTSTTTEAAVHAPSTMATARSRTVAEREHRRQQQRHHEVELLLDRQRPVVLERRRRREQRAVGACPTRVRASSPSTSPPTRRRRGATIVARCSTRRAATTTTSATATSAAGISRRARRSQNAANRIRPWLRKSASSSRVIRKPERVKNSETPRKPPLAHENEPWKNSTSSTANPRRPSSGGGGAAPGSPGHMRWSPQRMCRRPVIGELDARAQLAPPRFLATCRE